MSYIPGRREAIAGLAGSWSTRWGTAWLERWPAVVATAAAVVVGIAVAAVESCSFHHCHNNNQYYEQAMLETYC